MKRISRYITCGILGLILAAMGGCAGNQQVTVLKPVGPAATATRGHAPGYLIVYTAIEEPKINPDGLFYPHTEYGIYDAHGTFVRFVRNHLGPWDESPEFVSLSPGKYTVRAESEIRGEVAIPVIIRGAKTTVVNLERRDHSLAGL